MRNYFKVNGFVDLQLLVILRFRNLPITTKLLIKQVQKKKKIKKIPHTVLKRSLANHFVSFMLDRIKPLRVLSISNVYQ